MVEACALVTTSSNLRISEIDDDDDASCSRLIQLTALDARRLSAYLV